MPHGIIDQRTIYQLDWYLRMRIIQIPAMPDSFNIS